MDCIFVDELNFCEHLKEGTMFHHAQKKEHLSTELRPCCRFSEGLIRFKPQTLTLGAFLIQGHKPLWLSSQSLPILKMGLILNVPKWN